MVKMVLRSAWRTGWDDGDVDGGWRMKGAHARWTGGLRGGGRAGGAG